MAAWCRRTITVDKAGGKIKKYEVADKALMTVRTAEGRRASG